MAKFNVVHTSKMVMVAPGKAVTPEDSSPVLCRGDLELQRQLAKTARAEAHETFIARHEQERSVMNSIGMKRIACKQLLYMAANRDLSYCRKAVLGLVGVPQEAIENFVAHCTSRWKQLIADFEMYTVEVAQSQEFRSVVVLLPDGQLVSAFVPPQAPIAYSAVDLVSCLGVWFNGIPTGLSYSTRPESEERPFSYSTYVGDLRTQRQIARMIAMTPSHQAMPLIETESLPLDTKEVQPLLASSDGSNGEDDSSAFALTDEELESVHSADTDMPILA